MKKETVSVYGAGLLQGLALVAFPAASSILTSPEQFDFSSTSYGGLFVPQAIISIFCSWLSAKLARRHVTRPLFLIGLAFNFLAMALFALSAFFMHQNSLAYGVLLLATACLGVGFGLTVPALNTFAALLFPKKIDAAVLILNALLGLGTALAPVLVVVFVDFGIWWGLPACLAIAILAVFLFSLPIEFPLHHTKETAKQKKRPLASVFWLLAVFALLYGIVETMNGNWATLYMRHDLHASASISSLALCLFWALVTLGRIFFASIAKVFSPRYVFVLLPLLIAAAFVIISYLSTRADLGLFAFGLAGLGCSALLPLTISFGEQIFPSSKNFVVGNLIASYLLGYGISAFVGGALQDWMGWKLPTIFGISTFIAFTLAILAFFIIQTKKIAD